MIFEKIKTQQIYIDEMDSLHFRCNSRFRH